MEDMTESETSIAWLWVIEAMASFKEVNLSLIHDLVQEAPELPCGLAKNAKERIALRCLEDLCARQNRKRTSDVPSSAQDSKIEFDLSESCENVLQRIMQETSESDLKAGGPNLVKWVIQPFVRHKKAHLPKLALEKLRDSILDGTHPYAEFLSEKSGLGSTNRNNGVGTYGENRNSVTSRPNSNHSADENKMVDRSSDPLIVEDNDKQLAENLRDGDSLPSKRGRSDSTDVNKAGELENFDVQNSNLKKAKLNATYDNHNVEQNPVPLREKEPQEDAYERNVSVCTTTGGDLAGSEMGTVEKEGAVLEDGGDDCTVSKRSHDGDNDELRVDDPEIQPKADVMPQDTTTSEPRVHCSPEGSKDDNEVCAEPSGIPSVETMQKSPTKESKSINERDLEFQEPDCSAHDGLQEKTNASKARENANEGHEADISSDSDGYHKERTDVAMKKHEFLSSQVTDSHDFTVTGTSDQNLCMKCNEAGQALACCSDNCQVVVHEKCIGSSAIFDNKGYFYCPFCAYSLAITEYLEAKKRSSLSKKELGAFIRKGSAEHRPKKSSKKLKKKKKHRKGSCKDGQLKETRENEEIQVAADINEDSGRKHHNVTADNQQAEPSADCNISANVECEKVVDENPCVREREEKRNKVPKKTDNLVDAITDTNLVNQGNESLGIRPQVVKHQDVDSPKQLAQEFSISSEGDDDESTVSNYFIRIRTKQTQVDTYPSVPQSRRKKLPWTAEEEQKLKEGMEQMFSDERKISWKKVMEFGGPVFQDGRTPGDLKDKWRNMCRSQKSN